ncbi:hypothetical protein D9611_008119 [Ephemerocybe angulata]|uniref:Fungal-type protein kinase domain-containing protein n=1 Tax=Ephemerocybe angulata TaxID=980116 RepID=A0A8H5BZD4_9AGAR|nr:hypothetical protein D9611_008119 [Tulosesus angulatus]
MDLSGYEPPILAIGSNYLYELPNQGEDGSQSRFFLTTRSLHGTRVWEAIEVESRERPEKLGGAKPVVLKDARIANSRMTEKDIQTQLFDDIRGFAAMPHWREHALLSKFNEGEKDRLGELFVDDKFENLFLRISLEYRCVNASIRSPTNEGTAGKVTSAQADTGERRAAATSRDRVITVFEELCTALHDLPTLGEATHVLRQGAVALQLMMIAGWIHHDISSGNILAFRENEDAPWTVKLADLEYAHKYLPRGEHIHTKVGTPFFMPFEVQQQRRLNWFMLPGNLKATVIYDPQHDVESIWWIWLWIVSMRISGREASRTAYQSAFKAVAHMEDLDRQRAWTGSPNLKECVGEDLGDVAAIIHNLRLAFLRLCASHKDTSPQDNYDRYSEAHALLTDAFIQVDATRHVWELLPLVQKAEMHSAVKVKLDTSSTGLWDSCIDDGFRSAPGPQPQIELDDLPAEAANIAHKRTRPNQKASQEQRSIPNISRMTRSRTKLLMEETTRKAADRTPPMTRARTRLVKEVAAVNNDATRLKRTRKRTIAESLPNQPSVDNRTKKARYR